MVLNLYQMSKVFTEICKLSEKDCFHIAERHKTKFDYPLHKHEEFELNFVQHAQGVRRIVGDSVEEIGEYDLVLVGSGGLEHVWEQGSCTSSDIREITIQFSQNLFEGEMLSKNQFASIRRMLDNAQYGISFPMDTIMKVYHVLDKLALETSEDERFMQFLKFLYILYELSVSKGAKVLASSSFARHGGTEESRINCILVKICKHLVRKLRKLCLRITHRSHRVTVH